MPLLLHGVADDHALRAELAAARLELGAVDRRACRTRASTPGCRRRSARRRRLGAAGLAVEPAARRQVRCRRPASTQSPSTPRVREHGVADDRDRRCARELLRPRAAGLERVLAIAAEVGHAAGRDVAKIARRRSSARDCRAAGSPRRRPPSLRRRGVSSSSKIFDSSSPRSSMSPVCTITSSPPIHLIVVVDRARGAAARRACRRGRRAGRRSRRAASASSATCVGIGASVQPVAGLAGAVGGSRRLGGGGARDVRDHSADRQRDISAPVSVARQAAFDRHAIRYHCSSPVARGVRDGRRHAPGNARRPVREGRRRVLAQIAARPARDRLALLSPKCPPRSPARRRRICASKARSPTCSLSRTAHSSPKHRAPARC